MLRDVNAMTGPQVTAMLALASLDKDRRVLAWGIEVDGEWETCCGRFTVQREEAIDEWLDVDPGDVFADLDGRHVVEDEKYALEWHQGKELGSYDTLEDAQRMAELALQLAERYPERFLPVKRAL